MEKFALAAKVLDSQFTSYGTTAIMMITLVHDQTWAIPRTCKRCGKKHALFAMDMATTTMAHAASWSRGIEMLAAKNQGGTNG